LTLGIQVKFVLQKTGLFRFRIFAPVPAKGKGE